jgi:cell division protease FtsH
MSNESAENNIAFLMGGRVAEELVFKNLTTGAGNDIERATDLARRMVCEWGMSKMGPMTFGKKEEQIFLGREISKSQDYSEETAVAIDKEVKEIILRNYEKAKKILGDRIQTLHALADALVQREVLDGAEVDMIVQGKTLADIDDERKKRADILKAQNTTPSGEGSEEGKKDTAQGQMVTKPARA